jgi:two-component system response regulator FlrC
VPSVLVVDDESGIRDLLTRWLEDEKYSVRSAADAETALERMAEAPADVVLCDVEMPGHGGLWLVAQLGARFPEAAAILATALNSVSPQTSLQPNVVEYLVKPFDRTGLMKAIGRGLAWHATVAARPKSAVPMSDWLDSFEK